jgi:hypothetical protein
LALEADDTGCACAPAGVSCVVAELAGGLAADVVDACAARARAALVARRRARVAAGVLGRAPAPFPVAPGGVPDAAVVAVVDACPAPAADEVDVELPVDCEPGEGVVGVLGEPSTGTVGVVTGGVAGACGVDGVCTVTTPGTSTLGVGAL